MPSSVARAWREIAVVALVAGFSTTASAGENLRGLPFTRSYSYEEIGDVSRGARLNFDRFGRLAVIHRGAYVVLNDGTWIELAARSDSDRSILDLVKGPDGAWYYGALGGWGVADVSAERRIRHRPLTPANRPAWATATSFTYVVSTSSGVYFGGWNGVVHFDPRTRAQRFVAAPEVACVFNLGDRVFISSHRNGLLEIDARTDEARPIDSPAGAGTIDQTTRLDAQHMLVSTTAGRMFFFDGTRFSPWAPAIGNGADNRVLALQSLLDGLIAVAVSGRGLFILNHEGEIAMALTMSEYQRVTYLATHEPGVLWVATETGVDKVLYGTSVTIFGQRLGLPVSWPQVVEWHGRVIVASGGRLYSAIPGQNGHAARFELMPHQPPPASWGLAARGQHLLVGTSLGVFSAETDAQFTQVLEMDVARLVMTADDRCYAIGPDGVALLHFVGDRWQEIAPRIPGVGYPSVVHAFGDSAWIELGPNHAARVWFAEGKLHSRIFDRFPWTEPNWINLGMIGHTVILSGTGGKRIYYDDQHDAIVAAPEIEALLKRAPFAMARLDADSRGVLWATHDRGIFTITRDATGDHFDATRFDVIDDRTPFIYILPNDDVWVSSGQSLYHVDRAVKSNRPVALQPRLISVTDGRTNSEIVAVPERADETLKLPYDQNNLGLRFFAGGYNYRRAPAYEFNFGQSGEWTSAGNGSRLTFPGLREGAYHLSIRLSDSRGAVGVPLGLGFEILPPWYRTWYALFSYAVGMGFALFGLVKWSMQRAQKRNSELEQLVRKRTNELKATMDKLNEETRHAATLAERHRLAGEIHDSVQQGLSGLMLQIDATLKLASLGDAIRSRLTVARNMVSFTRHEVQHAVWNLESPLLEDTELADALHKLAPLISPGTAQIEVVVTGPPRALTPTVKHDLLRIAQEALTNAVRHAEPSHITLGLVYAPDRVELTIADDGKGFDPDAVLHHGLGHFGLRGLRARAQKIGGELEIESTPGMGTSIKVSVLTHEQRTPRPAINASV